MTPDIASIIDSTMQSIDRPDLPADLQNRIEKHKINLCNLAASLLEGGHDYDHVQMTISKVFDSFKEELLRTLIAIQENHDAI